MNNKNITIKNLDHLGLVTGMIDQLDIVRVIDTIIPSKNGKMVPDTIYVIEKIKFH